MGAMTTKHSEKRMRQRGVTDDVLDTLVGWADIAVPVCGGDTSLWLSREGAKELAAEGVSRHHVDRLKGLAAVVTRDGVVKTVLVVRKSGRGKRRYRRGAK